jgi:hypothetical protein
MIRPVAHDETGRPGFSAGFAIRVIQDQLRAHRAAAESGLNLTLRINESESGSAYVLRPNHLGMGNWNARIGRVAPGERSNQGERA